MLTVFKIDFEIFFCDYILLYWQNKTLFLLSFWCTVKTQNRLSFIGKQVFSDKVQGYQISGHHRKVFKAVTSTPPFVSFFRIRFF